MPGAVTHADGRGRGDAVDHHIERIDGELGWEFIQVYGLTETSPILTMARRREEWDGLEPDERARRLARAGAPVLGVRLAISDDAEVMTRANVVFEGYWSQPEESGQGDQGDGVVLHGRRRLQSTTTTTCTSTTGRRM